MSEDIADQLLSILVMDLGYTEEPLYGHTPLRHQIAWDMVVSRFDENNICLKTEVEKMLTQHELEIKLMNNP